jgi:A/G-specific adenine glycosylase
MNLLTPQQLEIFQTKILSWYEVHERDLPWRHTTNPYAILVSEIMSQQTQIARVVPKYTAWMEAIKALVNAPMSDVLTYWSGLGYNRRALFLQKTAKVILENNGTWPTSTEGLQKLPGIGKYTASAVACFAFSAQIPVIDTNIRKVISVEFCGGSVPDEKELEEMAWQILPAGKAKEWNQALMDYASAMLKKEKLPGVKQSKFIGSNRWYRGDLLKILTRQQSITVSQLALKWKKESEGTDKEWFYTLLQTLEKEGFIMIFGQTIRLTL